MNGRYLPTSSDYGDAPAYSLWLLKKLREHAALTPDRIVYRDVASAIDLTYGQLFKRAAALAHRLQSLGTKGAVVLICLPNICEFPIAFLGTLAAGCAALLVSTESPAMELRDVAAYAKAAVAIGANETINAIDGVNRIASDELMDDEASDFPAHGAAAHPRLLLLTSGSTGKPKIISRSGESLDAVSEQMSDRIGFASTDRVLSTVPLCHSYGIEHGLLAPVWSGSSVHLCRGLDLQLVSRELMTGGITILPGVPSMYEMLAQLADRGARLPHLRAAYSAGGPLPMSVSNAFWDRYGVRVSQLYGASEIGSVTYTDVHDDYFDPASVGKPMAAVRIRICAGSDPASEVTTGEEGQVWISAKSMFSGYVGEIHTSVVDGFFSTGDLGRVDLHGNLTITGRIKLLLDIGGLKVNPIEVEDVLMQHPAVGDCVVIPIRQSETVLRLKALVTARSASNPPMVEELRQFARQRLAAYKVPRSFEVRESLPRTSTGKILRHLVQA